MHATLIVAEGRVGVQAADAPPEHLSAGDAIVFNAADPHAISNEGDLVATAYLIIGLLRNAGAK